MYTCVSIYSIQQRNPLETAQNQVYVLESGTAMLEAHLKEPGRPAPLLYLSTTDFVQHKYEPEEEEAQRERQLNNMEQNRTPRRGEARRVGGERKPQRKRVP